MSPKISSSAHQGFDGPLAEFVALRNEIQDRVKAELQIFSLQITISGALFGFAISRPGMITLLLITPFTSYLLCGRLVAQHFGTSRIAKYITEDLSDRVPGGLRWEEWLERRQQQRPHLLGSTLPLLLAFVGASVLGLASTTGYVFAHGGIAVAPRLGLVLLWLVGLATAGLSAVLVLQMSGRLPLRDWELTRPS